MEKIIVREKVLRLGQTWSNFLDMTQDKSYNSTKELLKDFNEKEVLSRIFQEDVNSSILVDSSLFKMYTKALYDGKDNEFFKVMYKINERFAVHVSKNIYLYHLTIKEQIYDVVPWEYADSEKFLGDSWWEADEEILENIKSLSIIDFLDRYKGY